MKTRLLSLMLVLLMTLTLIPVDALAETAAENSCGSKGDNLTWALDENGVLTISGDGDMADYSVEAPAPWAECNIETVSIGEGVTGIGDYAFYYCSAYSFVLPDTLERIGAYAFAGICLTTLTIPESVKTIGTGSFSDCASLVSAALPQGLTELPDKLFDSCSGLTGVNIPESVVSIGAGAFKGCKALTVTSIPNGVKTIGEEAFSSCASVKELNIPASVERIGKNAFLSMSIEESAVFDGTPLRWTEIGGDDSGIDKERMTFLKHSCDFGTEWSRDKYSHWHECSGCGKI